jgi:pimeloyl-ACP methyl ester carboxylesterase
MSEEIDFTEQVRSLRVPTMVVGADADQVPPSAYMESFALLDGGQRDGGWMGEGRPKGGHALAIIPGVTHYSIFSSPLFAAVVLDFLGD